MSNRRFICDYNGGPCRMGIWMILWALIFVILLSSTARSQSPYVSGPTGLASQPVSQTQQSLFRSPYRYDVSGNSLVNGNVRGGSYFRGGVPYSSTTSFNGSVPSADTLYSFLRYSAGSEDFSREPGKYSQTMPYYNPSQTVTFTRPSQPGVFTPASASAIKGVSSGTGGELAQTNQSSGQILAGTASTFMSGPMSMGMQGTERLISADTGGLVVPGSRFDRSGVSTTEAAELRARQVRERAADLRIKPIGQEEVQQQAELSGQPYVEESVGMEDMAVKRIEQERMLEQMREQMLNKPEAKPEESQATTRSAATSGESSARSIEAIKRAIGTSVSGTEVAVGAGTEQQDLLDNYTRVKKQIDDLQEALRQLKAGEGDGEAPSAKKVSGPGDKPEGRKTVDAETVPEHLDVRRYSDADTEMRDFRKRVERLTSESGQNGAHSAAAASVEAKRILGGKSVEAFSKDKFNENMEAAKGYQKQGMYYRAASAYTLASIYKPAEPLAYAGRSQALFGAGEYMSSSLYLARAIEISPEYARTRVDLLAMLGTEDKEQLDNRIIEVEQWYKRSNAPELQFLLGYIYYQAGELGKAKEAIDIACARMPDSSAADALKKAVENK